MTAGGARRRNPCVFVVGCPRSGTTLLQRMLDAHPLLAVANDTHFIVHAVDAVAPAWRENPRLLSAEVERLVEWSRSYRRFRRLGLDAAAVDRAAHGAHDFAAFVSRLYDELARAKGKPLAGDKTPGYVRHLPLLDALFPHARVVHLVRDGRDVALSALAWATPSKGPGRIPSWSEDPVAVSALWWRRRVEAGRRDSGLLGPDRYLEVGYEELVASPGRILIGVARFLGLDFTEDMVAFNRGKARNRPGLSAKKAWLGATPGLRDWRRQMDADDVAVFEALAGDVLEATGYALQGGGSTAALARARRAREKWEEYWSDPSRSRPPSDERFGAAGSGACSALPGVAAQLDRSRDLPPS
jgi:hypothetical protein